MQNSRADLKWGAEGLQGQIQTLRLGDGGRERRGQRSVNKRAWLWFRGLSKWLNFNLRLHVGREKSPTCRALLLSEHDVKEYYALRVSLGPAAPGKNSSAPIRIRCATNASFVFDFTFSISRFFRSESWNITFAVGRGWGGWGIKRQQTNTPGRQTSLNAAAGGTHSTVAALLRLSLVPLAAPDEHMPTNLDVKKKNKKKTREKSKPLLALCLCCVLREQPEGRANSGRNQIYICYRSRGRRAGLLRGAANGATLPAIFHRTHLQLLWPSHSTSLPHLSPTSATLCVCVCVWDRNNDSSDQRRPRWLVSFHQGWENKTWRPVTSTH